MVQYGLNFNPDGPNGQPTDRKALQGVKWGRMVFMADDQRRSVDQAFKFYDPLVDDYNANGVGVLFVVNHQTLKGSTPWVSGGDWAGYATEFGKVCGQIAAHYKNKNVAFEIWNEQDFGTSSTHIMPDKYALVLSAAYQAIKKESTALVVTGGLASAPDVIVDYIKQAKKAGGNKLPADAIAFHPYGQWTPNFSQAPGWGGWFAPLADYMKIIDKGMPDLPLWITEAGVSEAVPFPPEQYPLVTKFMQGMYDLIQTKYADRVPVIVWFAWSDRLRNAGIVDGSNTPKKEVYDKFFSLVSAANIATQVSTTAQTAPRKTPYDGKIGWWHWKGSVIAEKTIEELLATIKSKTPNATSIFVKTNSGSLWMGAIDPQSPADLKVSSKDDVARWVRKCADAGFDFHAWSVVKGRSPESEIALMADVCNVPGVKSFILDVEVGSDYYQGGSAGAQKIGTDLRQRIPDGFHLGLCLDARGNHPRDVYIDKWLPSIDSLHPMCYHVTFQLDPDQTVNIALNALEKYGLPVIPALQAFRTTKADEINTAAAAALNSLSRVRPQGISFWRYGKELTRNDEFAAISAIQMPTLGERQTDGQATARHTNQDVINAFDAAAKAVNEPNFWNWVISADLTYLASDRTRAYTGPAIAALPGLSAEQKSLIQRALDGLPLDTTSVISFSVIGKFTNQEIINAFYEAARQADQKDDYFQWITDAGLANIVQDRKGTFKGPEISDLPKLTDDQKRSISAVLQGTPVPPTPITGQIKLDVPWISQIDSKGLGNHDCGQACVLMILQYNTLATTKKLSDIAKKVDIEENGTTPGDLQWLAKEFGLALTIDTDLTDANACVKPLGEKRPVILLVDYKMLGFEKHLASGVDQGFHWLLVVGHDNSGSFLVHDPLWTASMNKGKGGAFLSISHDTLTAAMAKSGQRYQSLY